MLSCWSLHAASLTALQLTLYIDALLRRLIAVASFVSLLYCAITVRSLACRTVLASVSDNLGHPLEVSTHVAVEHFSYGLLASVSSLF